MFTLRTLYEMVHGVNAVRETRGRNTFSHEIIYFFIRELKLRKKSAWVCEFTMTTCILLTEAEM
jgi:hypothetical protein